MLPNHPEATDRRCPRCGKRLVLTYASDVDGGGTRYDCLNCDYREDAGAVPLSRVEVRELIRLHRERPPMSPKCRARLHEQCTMSGCGCWHHTKEAS